jgi:ubiquitin C-terminal hydrolase
MTLICTMCGNHWLHTQLDSHNEAWSCPVCGMDESGLIPMGEVDGPIHSR